MAVPIDDSEEGETAGTSGVLLGSSSSSLPHPPQAQSNTIRTNRLSPHHFTFSSIDVFKNSVSKRQQQFMQKISNTKRRKQSRHSSSCLWCGFMAIILCQSILFLFQTSISNYYHHQNMVASHGEMGLALFLSKSHRHNAKNAETIRKVRGTIRPRLLIGIFSDYGSNGGSKAAGGSTNSKTYRNRHRKLFRLWNDTRLCPYNAFRQRQRQLHAAKQNHDDDDQCLILYTFVIGAHRNNGEAISETIPTMRLQGTPDEPLEIELPASNSTTLMIPEEISNNLPSDLKNRRDFTLLNIRENMNDGKSPSFFAWAHSEATSPRNIGDLQQHSQQSSMLLFSYAAKCDLDAMLRLDFVLQVLHNELMWVVPNNASPNPPTAPVSAETLSTFAKKVTTPLKTDTTSVGGIVLGCLRHKAMWADTTNDGFWRANYQNGMHLYLGGQFYIVSVNLIPGLVQEAQVQQLKPGMQTNITGNNNYMAGHEDHDVLSMIQAAAVKNGQLVRWISMPRNYRFWEHPVKGGKWWKRIWEREERKATEGRLPSRNTYSLPIAAPKPLPSLLIVLGAKDPKDRVSYREKLITEQRDRRICSLMEYQTTDTSATLCDLVYAFVVGGNHDGGPNEIVRGEDQIELNDSQASEKDVVVLNIRDNTDSGMGQTVLFHLQTVFQSKLETSFDMVVFCNAQTVLSVEQWNRVQYQQTRVNRNLIVGDIRDKDQLPVEFGTKRRNETYFYLEQENIHVYPGSDNACFAVSTNLVENMLHHANESFGLSKDVKVIREDSSRKRKFKIFNPRAYFVQNLGYDLSTLAYMTPFTILHWIPISKGQAPWYPL
mmetsp:Transcript_17512/g.43030  ORF Transcript_17512/g.43030 Transcript_17512/m.43030 type:complete len:827 (+) Transcript_17512:131-2611(+)